MYMLLCYRGIKVEKEIFPAFTDIRFLREVGVEVLRKKK